MPYIAGQTVYVSGFVTAEKFIINQTLLEIEKRLGYQQGRLTDGASFLLLTSIPSEDDFELKGYSNVPGHRFTMSPGTPLVPLTDAISINFNIKFSNYGSKCKIKPRQLKRRKGY